eukprot:203118_1
MNHGTVSQVLVLLCMVQSSFSLINRFFNGDIWPCNFNAYESGKIEKLSFPSDISKINKLEQVHIWFRHGIRIGGSVSRQVTLGSSRDNSICSYFPTYCLNNTSNRYKCNVTSIIDINFNTNNTNSSKKTKKI